MDHLEEDRTKELVKKLILKIKQKRELKWISDAVVNEKLFEYLKQKPKLNLENKCSADYRQVIKEIRAKLRSAYGLFREEKVEVGNFKNIKEILTRHSSTKERVEFYPRLYQKLFKITGKVSSILDLGCGINPFSIEFMGLNRLNYYAYDINEKEINLLNRYFSRKNQENKAFRGQAEVLDISKVDRIKKLPPADLCLMFKITDILDEGKGHKKTEDLLKAVPARFVAISFPTLTMSGKPMTAPRRSWMEWLCRRLEYSYKILVLSNEIIYVIKKRL